MLVSCAGTHKRLSVIQIITYCVHTYVCALHLESRVPCTVHRLHQCANNKEHIQFSSRLSTFKDGRKLWLDHGTHEWKHWFMCISIFLFSNRIRYKPKLVFCSFYCLFFFLTFHQILFIGMCCHFERKK